MNHFRDLQDASSCSLETLLMAGFGLRVSVIIYEPIYLNRASLLDSPEMPNVRKRLLGELQFMRLLSFKILFEKLFEGEIWEEDGDSKL